MAVTHWWLGYNTATTATVVCRSDSTTTVTVTCDGRTFTAAADTSVNRGIVLITVTGIDSTRRPYCVDGVLGGTLRAKRQTGPWWVAYGSCWDHLRSDALAGHMHAHMDLDALFLGGDLAYGETTGTINGYTLQSMNASIALSQSAANYEAHQMSARLMFGLRELMRSVPTQYMPDDHEYPGTNGRNRLTVYQRTFPSAIQADLDTAWAAARAVNTAWSTGNVPNMDAGIDSDASYTRDTLGAMEWFMTDSIHYGDDPETGADTAVADGANPTKTMLGATQRTWLTTRLNASTAPFKLWVTGKELWRTGTNTDTFFAQGPNFGFLGEVKRILWDCKTVTGWTVVAGDQHRSGNCEIPAGYYGATYPALASITGCPSSVDQNTTTYAGYDAEVKFRDNQGVSAAPAQRENVYALIKVAADGSRMDRYHLSSLLGLRHRGYLVPGSNAIQYNAAGVA